MILIKIYPGPWTVTGDGPPICSHLMMASPRVFYDHMKHYRTQRQWAFSCSLFYPEVSLSFLSCWYSTLYKNKKHQNHHNCTPMPSTTLLHSGEGKLRDTCNSVWVQGLQNVAFIEHHSARKYLFTCSETKQAFLERARHTAGSGQKTWPVALKISSSNVPNYLCSTGKDKLHVNHRSAPV